MASPTMADDIRTLARERYVVPARAAGQETVEINVGDVHKAMGYKHRLPLVAAALIAVKFRNENRLQLIRTDGPRKSTHTTYVFKLE